MLASFIVYVSGLIPHYITYKQVNTLWHEYDDRSIWKKTLEGTYQISLAFFCSKYENHEYTGYFSIFT